MRKNFRKNILEKHIRQYYRKNIRRNIKKNISIIKFLLNSKYLKIDVTTIPLI